MKRWNLIFLKRSSFRELQIASLISFLGEKFFEIKIKNPLITFLMMPFDAYKQYLSLKNHFTKEKYDYHKYCGKSRATVQSFYKRKDRFWFEKLARNKDDKEVIEFFVSNFITCTDPSKILDRRNDTRR